MNENRITRGDGIIINGHFGAVLYVNEARGLVSVVMFPRGNSTRFDVWTVPEQVAAMEIIVGDYEIVNEKDCPFKNVAPWPNVGAGIV